MSKFSWIYINSFSFPKKSDCFYIQTVQQYNTVMIKPRVNIRLHPFYLLCLDSGSRLIHFHHIYTYNHCCRNSLFLTTVSGSQMVWRSHSGEVVCLGHSSQNNKRSSTTRPVLGSCPHCDTSVCLRLPWRDRSTRVY